ncbi:MAG: hypothetical protein Q8L72_01045 [Moraxellaceae bacterium]|nr:hypothetical protein [Moraxellaceae bacterium]
MPRKQTIPTEIQEEVLKIVEEFNRKTFTGEHNPILKALFGKTKRGFAARFKGKFLYLDRTDRGRPSEICRLTWNGKMDNWGFAIIGTPAISTIPTNGCLQAQAM